MMADVDQLYGAENRPASRKAVIESMYPYIEQQLANGTYLGHISRHLLGLFHGQRGGRQFRRYLSENAHISGAGLDVLKGAVEKVTD